ncbi:hypothetical protein OS493_028052 [Desmophyllum pertusum]|uniref:Uncharacterized protein n=1 Tax=Desmophyllum pertusum TaxID=174260 RepID=A0A9W9ZZ09_9CNID|nr:hypothetical protein OS493_028052 [Desmophyllum pertusum]
METECDFMEIDNNIASRLQIPSLHQQRDGDIPKGLPEGLPVPMLANFGHFENSDETESSFMSGGDVEAQEKPEESADSSEQGEENNESSLTVTVAETPETTQSVQEPYFEELQTLNVEVSLAEQEDSVENPKQNFAVQGGDLKVDTADLFSSFGEGHADIETIDSLFCGEGLAADSEDRTHHENYTTTGSCYVEPEKGEPDTKPSIVHDQNGVQGQITSTSVSIGTDPLFDTVNELPLRPSNPLNERENVNDFSPEGLFRVESPDREFVFVNRDGTAVQVEHRPPRHPLEDSDEF